VRKLGLYGHIYREVLQPAYEKSRRRSAHVHFREALANQWKTAEELRALQWQELKKLLDHAFEQSPWYRERFLKLGLTPSDIRSPDDYGRLPPITRDDIREHRHAMLATNYRSRVYEHSTGGSTGTPLTFFASRGSYEWRLAVSMRGYSWADCCDGDRQFHVWGAPAAASSLKQRLKVGAHNTLRRRKMFNSFELSDARLTECVHQLNAFRPKTVIGYTTSLYLLARHIRDGNLAIARPDAVITAAEGVNVMQREVIESAFGAPVFGSYGSREFMLIAMECEHHSGLHQSVDNLYVEVVANGRPAADGEIGEVLITDLHNWGMPFIRYKIGDLAVPTGRICSCGRGLPLLDRVEGRVLDAIRTSDGRIVTGEFFPQLMKEFAAVRQFQVIQKQIDQLDVKLVLADGNHSDLIDHLQEEVSRVLGSTVRTRFETVDRIAQTSSGKFRVTMSELPPL
jgi:phenylacetate-CoA ligase